jgi:hypothetical protein
MSKKADKIDQKAFEHTIQPLQSERDKRKSIKKKEEEYQNILDKFQNIKNCKFVLIISIAKLKKVDSDSAREPQEDISSHIVSTPDLYRKAKGPESKRSSDAQNPYKRDYNADVYNSVERKNSN